MFARFDENPAMTLQDIKETKRYGRTDRRTHTRTHAHTHARTDNVKTVYPPQTKFAGGINIEQLQIPTMEVTINNESTTTEPPLLNCDLSTNALAKLHD